MPKHNQVKSTASIITRGDTNFYTREEKKKPKQTTHFPRRKLSGGVKTILNIKSNIVVRVVKVKKISYDFDGVDGWRNLTTNFCCK